MKEYMDRINAMQSIVLKGRVLEDNDQAITLRTEGGLLTISKNDVLEMQQKPEGGESEISVAQTAKIVFEALVSPLEAKGILSKEAVVEIVNSRYMYRGECECSRCTGGECECSRCTDQMGRLGSISPGYMYRGECECSRCTGGECECSRCTDRMGRFGSISPGYMYRGECECSRCTGGECECSRCTDQFGSFGLPQLGGFRRRIA